MGLETILMAVTGLAGAAATAKGVHDQKKAQEDAARAMAAQKPVVPVPNAPSYDDVPDQDIFGARQE
jgi:hypothetical protein